MRRLRVPHPEVGPLRRRHLRGVLRVRLEEVAEEFRSHRTRVFDDRQLGRQLTLAAW